VRKSAIHFRNTYAEVRSVPGIFRIHVCFAGQQQFGDVDEAEFIA
jgi:hypothetical protein